MAHAFKDLIGNSTAVEVPDSPKGKGKKKSSKRGCEDCPLNKEGCVKIIGLSRIEGRKVFVWAQSPGWQETQFVYTADDGSKKRGMELVGPSGSFFWREAAKVGIDREDCDIQNVVRCRPTAYNEEKGRDFDRKPTKEEIKHCSIYTEKAIEKNAGKAKVHIVLGLVAAAALLGKEYRKGRTVFWSEKLGAKVICIAHPAYFLREGYAKTKLHEFRQGLREAASIIKGNAGRFAFIMSQDFKAIDNASDFATYARHLKAASKKERVVIDIEDGPRDNECGRAMLCCGFSFEPGHSRTVYYDKTDVKVKGRSEIKRIFGELFEDPDIRFCAQNWVHDDAGIKKMLGFKVANKDYDTRYAEYCYDSSRRSYALAEIAEARFQQYAGYKDIIVPYVGNPTGEYDGEVDYDKIPHHIMTPYNGADCSLTKEIEVSTRKKVSLPLVHVYIDASYIFEGMNNCGPLLDYQHYDTVLAVLPGKIQRIKQQLALMAMNPKFNPGSPKQVQALLYDTLDLEPVTVEEKGKVKLITNHNALEYLKQFHDAPGLIDDYRSLTKMFSTYMLSFKASADLHDGELRTIWWLTGTTTGRLRSGKGKTNFYKRSTKKKKDGIVNLQNVHGDPLIKNLLVSDVNWRKVLSILDEDEDLRKSIKKAVKEEMEKRRAVKEEKQ